MMSLTFSCGGKTRYFSRWWYANAVKTILTIILAILAAGCMPNRSVEHRVGTTPEPDSAVDAARRFYADVTDTTGAVGGWITNLQGEPIFGAGVRVIPIKVKGGIEEADVVSITNEQGYYERTMLPPGTYDIQVYFQGHLLQSKSLHLEAREAQQLDFVVSIPTPEPEEGGE